MYILDVITPAIIAKLLLPALQTDFCPLPATIDWLFFYEITRLDIRTIQNMLRVVMERLKKTACFLCIRHYIWTNGCLSRGNSYHENFRHTGPEWVNCKFTVQGGKQWGVYYSWKSVTVINLMCLWVGAPSDSHGLCWLYRKPAMPAMHVLTALEHEP